MQYFETAIATPEGVLEAVMRVTNALLAARWPKEEVDQLRIGIIEAITNAAKHGNTYDPAKKVRVELRMAADYFEMTVIDQGEGFDPDTVQDPIGEKGLLGTSGRGIFMMRGIYFDDVRYNEKGNAVTLVRDFSKFPKRTAA